MHTKPVSVSFAICTTNPHILYYFPFIYFQHVSGSDRSTMSFVKYAIVEFKEGDGRKVNRYVSVRDIKNFNPASAADIPDHVVDVKWQDGFHADDLEDDGCWPGKILLLGGKCHILVYCLKFFSCVVLAL